TTLIYDRGRKASLYAMRGVADYWIVNVNDDQLEIHRDPGADLAQPFGYGYASLTVCHRGEMVTPQAAPHLSFSVADLLGRDCPPRAVPVGSRPILAARAGPVPDPVGVI